MKGDRIIIAVIVGVFLVLYTIIAYSFTGAESGEMRQTYLLLLAAPMALVAFRYPKAALYMIAVLIYVLRWFVDTLYLLPREVTYVTDVLIVILFVRAIPQIIRRIGGRQQIALFVLGLLAFALLSGLLNGVSAKPMLAGTRLAFHFLLLFVAAQYLNFTKGQLKTFIALMFIIGLAQTPIVLYQSKILKLSWDAVVGTFGLGQTPGIALFILVLLSYLGARMIETRRARTTFIAAVLWMTVCPIAGSAKFYFLMLPALIVFMFRTEIFRRPALSLAMLVTACALFFAGDRLAASAGGMYDDLRPLKILAKLPQFYRHDIEIAASGRYDRGYQFVSAIQLAGKSPRRMLLGYGPGSATQSQFGEAASVHDFAENWGLVSSMTMPILWLLIEYGYLGLGLFFVLFWLIYRRAKVLKASDDVDMRIYGRMLQNIVFLYFAWTFYQSAWQSDSMAFIFWCPAGLLVGLSYAEQRRQLLVKQAEQTSPVGQTLPVGASA